MTDKKSPRPHNKKNEDNKLNHLSMNEKTINLAIIILYLIGCLTISINIITAGRERLILSLMSPLFILLPLLLEKIFKLKRNYMINNFFYVFVFFAYCIGTTMGVYLETQVYDKIVHMFSGLLFFAVGAYIYELIQRSDFKAMSLKRPGENAFYMFFSFLFSMATACLWEIYEYVYDVITGSDSQHVLDTGINDTMQDMIMCLFGALLGIMVYTLFMKLARRGEKSF